MDKTLFYYNENADSYAQNTFETDMSFHYAKILKYCSGGLVLDCGCGSGRDSLFFMKHGFEVEGFDGSEKLCAIAKERTGLNIKCMTYQKLAEKQKYDVIWSCASLLHVPKSDLKDVIIRLYNALKDKGIMYVAVKYGEGEKVDNNNRYFNYFNETDLDLFEKAGFKVLEYYHSADVRKGRNDRWLNIILEK